MSRAHLRDLDLFPRADGIGPRNICDTSQPSRRDGATLVALALSLLLLAAAAPGWAAEKPKVRAITAFVRLDREHYKDQITAALQFLDQAKKAYEKDGYEVQTIRISTQPFPEYTKGLSTQDVLAFFHDYDQLAGKEKFITAIGPAMVADSDDPRQAELLAQILRITSHVDASLVVAGDDGVNWNAVRAAAKVMKSLAEGTPHSQGNFNFSAIAMVPPLTPFFPGSYHTGFGHQFAVALQSANVVAEAFTGAHDAEAARRTLTDSLTLQATAVQAIASRIDLDTGWSYVGIDLSPAPLREVSIGAAIEKFLGAKIGSSGTMTAVSIITSVLRDTPVKHAGYSGLMLPVLEDSVLSERWGEGALTVDSLLAYSAVCGTGLDTIPLPGDVTEEQLARMIGDMASLAFKLKKPLSARLLPVAGKHAGERTEFEDPFLVNTTLRPLP